MKHFFLYPILLLLLLACQNNELGYSNEKAYKTEEALFELDEETSVEVLPTSQTNLSDTTERKLIKTANIQFEIEEIEPAIKEVEALVEGKKGIIISNNLENNTYRISQSFTIRVPNNHFDTLVEGLASIAVVLDSKEINAQDVTEEFVDVTARLKAKKQIENRYLSILEQAKSVADILEVEKKLGEIREEIEATEGRLRYLQNQVALSTINLYVYQRLEQKINTLAPSFLERVGKGLSSGWTYFLDFLVGLSYSWPFILIGLVLIFFIRKWIVKRRARKKEA